MCCCDIFLPGFYTARHVGCYVGGLSELCHKCENHICKGLKAKVKSSLCLIKHHYIRKYGGMEV